MEEHGIHWGNIPSEMREYPQWCLANALKAPVMPNIAGGTYNCSPTVGPWLTFNDACRWAKELGLGIGFILTENDPFTCIDFDIKDGQSIDRSTGEHLPPSKWTQMFQIERYLAIKQAFNSYTELSTSQKGMHIWIRGTVPKTGLKRDGVEIYTKDRFMVCTGIAVDELYYSIFSDIVLACYPRIDVLPIAERQDLLNRLVEEVGAAGAGVSLDVLEELEPTETDEVIWARALAADNATKFRALCEGDWAGMGYPSQSEADLSLLSMFTFYSKSNSQVRRMFRQTGLGVREKAVKDDRYLNASLKLIRGRMKAESERVEQASNLANLEVQRLVQEMQAKKINDITSQAVNAVALPQVQGLAWPPGMAGALAAFIYNSAPRPVKEVGIVAALGLLAGICGKAYTIQQSGLNLYITLVARSAVGKEAMHSGIALILEKLRNSIPGVLGFVDFSEQVSGPALIKAVTANKSFVNISGEWGRNLKAIAQEKNPAKESLRTVMTNLYQKSGPSAIVGGLNYSNKDSNVGSVSGVAYSFIGETTPRTFYESLTESMMEDGFLSRFNIIEYDGERPPLNENQVTQLDDRLYNALCSLVVQCITLLQNQRHVQVQFDPEAYAALRRFDKECDQQINSTTDEGWRQMWNRAHLKASRIAALLAVADNFVNPLVTPVHTDWALEVIRRDIEIMSRKIREGDVGQGDGVRERKLVTIIKSFFQGDLPVGYKIPEAMVDDGIVPRKFLQLRTSSLSQFSTHRLGSTVALDLTIKSLIDSGYIMEVDKDKLFEKYSFQGRCFRILNLG